MINSIFNTPSNTAAPRESARTPNVIQRTIQRVSNIFSSRTSPQTTSDQGSTDSEISSEEGSSSRHDVDEIREAMANQMMGLNVNEETREPNQLDNPFLYRNVEDEERARIAAAAITRSFETLPETILPLNQNIQPNRTAAVPFFDLNMLPDIQAIPLPPGITLAMLPDVPQISR